MCSHLADKPHNPYTLLAYRQIVCMFSVFVWQDVARKTDWRGAMTEKSVIAVGLRRALALRCPRCGKGHLFSGFLKVNTRCEVCGSDNTIYPSDDAPPYLTLALVGHVF